MNQEKIEPKILIRKCIRKFIINTSDHYNTQNCMYLFVFQNEKTPEECKQYKLDQKINPPYFVILCHNLNIANNRRR